MKLHLDGVRTVRRFDALLLRVSLGVDDDSRSACRSRRRLLVLRVHIGDRVLSLEPLEICRRLDELFWTGDFLAA